MNIVLDMNMSRELVDVIRAGGHTCQHWSEIGHPSTPDVDIAAWAQEHSAVVVTCDLDFGDILAMSGAEGPSVVLIRERNVQPHRIGQPLLDLLDAHSFDLNEGALVVMEGFRSRLRILPFN
jgi:predicted nuclease of predicted toxin-antitoxin system